MVNITDKKKCCGCNACKNICPKNAISMNDDEYGFKYPVINKKKCIECNLCEKVCPIINNKKEQPKNIKVFACYNKNEYERINSSSGGTFILLAKEIIKRNGVVFGAAFDKNFILKHKSAQTDSELIQFMGSKYVQSDTELTYTEVKKHLENGKYVYFSGTPCQIEGLLSYLGKDYEKLFTQDIFCFGVPSPKAFSNYLNYTKKSVGGDILNRINFRNKDEGWKEYQVNISYKNGKEYIQNHNNDLYMTSFLESLILRDSCLDCKFKKKHRLSDITLADFWGIEKIHSDMFDNKGTSLVLLNSKKGIDLFNIIKDDLIFKEVELDEAIQFNPLMITSAKKSPNRESFLKSIKDKPYDIIAKKYIKKR